MSHIGYLRVSTFEQLPDRQIIGLESICDELHLETISATAKSRPVYESVMAQLQANDTLVVWSIDRIWRSVVDTICAVENLKERNINLKIIDMDIDLATPAGKLFLSVVASMAEFERNMISVRTKEGLAAARQRGIKLGRPSKLTAQQVSQASADIEAGRITITARARELGVCRDTLSLWITRQSIQSEIYHET